MRTIKFNVTNQTIAIDPSCDFSNFKRDHDLTAEFEFSSDWDGFVRVAGFSRGGEESVGRTLMHGSTCTIPKEMLKGSFFRLYVLGKKGEVTRKTLNFIVLL